MPPSPNHRHPRQQSRPGGDRRRGRDRGAATLPGRDRLPPVPGLPVRPPRGGRRLRGSDAAAGRRGMTTPAYWVLRCDNRLLIVDGDGAAPFPFGLPIEMGSPASPLAVGTWQGVPRPGGRRDGVSPACPRRGCAFAQRAGRRRGLRARRAGGPAARLQRQHRFCGQCGTLTERLDHEHVTRCPACGLIAYPRISPAASRCRSARATSYCSPAARASSLACSAPWPVSSNREKPLEQRCPPRGARGGRNRYCPSSLLRQPALALSEFADGRLPPTTQAERSRRNQPKSRRPDGSHRGPCRCCPIRSAFRDA